MVGRDSNRDWGSFDLRDELTRAGGRSTASQVNLVSEFARKWQDHPSGVLPDGTNVHLWKCCTHSAECWSRLDGPEFRSTDRGGITLPWVGPDYEKSRVALMGLNLVKSGGLLDEISITASTIEAFAAGRMKVWDHTWFQYRSTAMLAAVLAALDGRPFEDGSDPPAPETLIESLLRTARIQAVKCSPWGEGSSPPTPEMKRLCPKALMPTDLEILKPRVLLVVHKDARGALWQLTGGKVNRWHDQPGLTVGTATLGSEPFTVIGVTHPSARGSWRKSWNLLITHLNGGDPFLKLADVSQNLSPRTN